MIPRTVFQDEHETFRATVANFLEKEVAPHHRQWENDGVVSRDVWRKAGSAGLLNTAIPDEMGGLGGNFLHAAIVIEEMGKTNASGPNFPLHSDIICPYLQHYGSKEQQQTWLPRMTAGEIIGAIAMTEPGAGSDLQGIQTTAKRDGDDYVINGQKVYISNGQLADLIIVACKTDPSEGWRGISLILVEATREGFSRGKNLEKIGMHAQDTSELFFDNVRVPRENLLGPEEGKGFIQLVSQLPQERLIQAVRGAAVVEGAIKWTLDYTRDRKAFGKSILSFQNTQFKLAELQSHAAMLRTFVDRCLELHIDGKLTAEDAAMAKMNATDLQCRTLDECLQLHGGAGYMWEYPIAQAWADSRMSRIAGGSAEIMKQIIAKDMMARNS
ncbi:acyl-CoA dehydrogenase family protein [Minwuia sp.]|uniref:acyl-CoA dehydrogenase family protein n=1 Tax=Minwuia sp. TaxID=2493630 RepID=UPI003A8CEE5E